MFMELRLSSTNVMFVYLDSCGAGLCPALLRTLHYTVVGLVELVIRVKIYEMICVLHCLTTQCLWRICLCIPLIRCLRAN